MTAKTLMFAHKTQNENLSLLGRPKKLKLGCEISRIYFITAELLAGCKNLRPILHWDSWH